jgi:hypothetical protein
MRAEGENSCHVLLTYLGRSCNGGGEVGRIFTVQ